MATRPKVPMALAVNVNIAPPKGTKKWRKRRKCNSSGREGGDWHDEGSEGIRVSQCYCGRTSYTGSCWDESRLSGRPAAAAAILTLTIRALLALSVTVCSKRSAG